MHVWWFQLKSVTSYSADEVKFIVRQTGGQTDWWTYRRTQATTTPLCPERSRGKKWLSCLRVKAFTPSLYSIKLYVSNQVMQVGLYHNTDHKLIWYFNEGVCAFIDFFLIFRRTPVSNFQNQWLHLSIIESISISCNRHSMVMVWQTVLLSCCYDCDCTQQHYDIIWFEHVLWHYTMHDWIMNIHYQTWITQGQFPNIILTPSKQCGMCDNMAELSQYDGCSCLGTL